MKEKKVIGPILGCIVFTIIGFVVYQFIGGSIGQIIDAISGNEDGLYINISCIVAIIIYLLIYQGANKKVFDGCLKSENMGIGFLINLPVAIMAVIGILITIFTTDHRFGVTGKGIVLSLYAGICEEIVFRAIPVAHMMRCYNDEKKLPVVVLLTSFFFSVTHIANFFMGADGLYTVIQVLHTFAVGMLYAVSYLRCGSIVPCIALHFLNDAFAFADLDMFMDGAVMSDGSLISTADIVTGVISVILFAAVAIYAMRPAKRKEIIDLWAKKWSKE